MHKSIKHPLEDHGHEFKVIPVRVSSHIQLHRCKWEMCGELGLNRSVILPEEYNKRAIKSMGKEMINTDQKM